MYLLQLDCIHDDQFYGTRFTKNEKSELFKTILNSINFSMLFSRSDAVNWADRFWTSLVALYIFTYLYSLDSYCFPPRGDVVVDIYVQNPAIL